MSELFLELFSEEIPVALQKDLREKLLENFKSFFDKYIVNYKQSFLIQPQID